MSSATEIIFEALLGHFFGQGGAQRQGTQEGGYQHQQQQTPAGPMSGVVNYLSDFRTQAFAAALKVRESATQTGGKHGRGLL